MQSGQSSVLFTSESVTEGHLELDLLRPIYRQTASYGHFGRSDLDLPWENTHHAPMRSSRPP